jgi:hypothetical protein
VVELILLLAPLQVARLQSQYELLLKRVGAPVAATATAPEAPVASATQPTSSSHPSTLPHPPEPPSTSPAGSGHVDAGAGGVGRRRGPSPHSVGATTPSPPPNAPSSSHPPSRRATPRVQRSHDSLLADAPPEVQRAAGNALVSAVMEAVKRTTRVAEPSFSSSSFTLTPGASDGTPGATVSQRTLMLSSTIVRRAVRT